MMTDWHLPWLLAVVASVALGGLVGCWQGFWIAYVGIPAFIVTLGGHAAVPRPGHRPGRHHRGRPAGRLQRDQQRLAAATPSGFLGHTGRRSPCSSASSRSPAWSSPRLRARTALHPQRPAGRAVRRLRSARLVVSAPVIAAITYLLAKSAGGTPIVLIIVGAAGHPLHLRHGQDGLRPARLRDGRQPARRDPLRRQDQARSTS